MKRIPDQTTISYFLNHILDEEARKKLDFAAETIEKISGKFGIILDVKTLEPEKPKKQTKSRNQSNLVDKKTREICRLFKKQFSPFIDLNLHPNVIYTKNQFLDLMMYMGQTRDFAENGSKTYMVEMKKRRMFCPKCNLLILPSLIYTDNGKLVNIFKCMNCGYEKGISPSADTLLYHLKNYEDFREIQKMYITLFDIVWERARKANVFNRRSPVGVAIDFTELYFYGDRSTPMVVGKEPDRGTTKCYKFATINIVESGKRFTLLALPVGPFDEKEKILRQLLSYALERIKIGRIYIDRGFFNADCIKVFNSFHLRYLMPAIKISTIKDVMEIAPAPLIITDFEMKDVRFNLVIVEEEMKDGKKVKRAFATNEYFDENDVNMAERLFHLYGKRWGIETSYRVKKHSYLPKTTSTEYLIRLFYFLFSVLMYNLWILADVLVWLALFGKVKNNHLVTSKLFGTKFYTIDPDRDE